MKLLQVLEDSLQRPVVVCPCHQIHGAPRKLDPHWFLQVYLGCLFSGVHGNCALNPIWQTNAEQWHLNTICKALRGPVCEAGYNMDAYKRINVCRAYLLPALLSLNLHNIDLSWSWRYLVQTGFLYPQWGLAIRG